MIASLILFLQPAALPEGAATAQQAGPPALCQAFEVGAPDPGRTPREGAVLYVGCGQSAVRVGKVESYRSSFNPRFATLAVAVRESGRTRVLVVRAAADGTIEVQDVSRDLAKLAGQPANVELRSLEVDIGDFAGKGTIAAPRGGQAASGARLIPDHYLPPAAERRQASSGGLPGRSPQ